ITSAIEGLKELPRFHEIGTDTVIYVVLFILCIFFFAQQFGTKSIGKFFGPVMTVWFSMLAVLGIMHIADDFTILRALNPWYAIHFLFTYPDGFWLLGAVFLCTTGAEALYSDLGHCGRGNIRISWVFVKICLLLNYFGQGASLLKYQSGKFLSESVRNAESINAFYDLMPQWFVLPGVIIATFAAITASQAMVTGS